MSTKYNVVVLGENGMPNSLLFHMNKSEWTLKTAKRYADEFKADHGKDCIVVDASEPISSVKPVYSTSQK